MADHWDDMVRQYGEPLSYGAHSFNLQALIQAGIPGVIVGTGPDAWSLYRGEALALRYHSIPAPLRSLARPLIKLAARLKPGMAHGLRTIDYCARTNLSASLSTPVADDALRGELWRHDAYPDAGGHKLPDILENLNQTLAHESAHDRLTFSAVVRSAEAVLFWNHQWSRAHNLPIRHPYYDNDFYDFMMRLPRKQYGKPELRTAAATFMPHDMAYASKIYQALPLDAWFRGPLKSFVHDQLAGDRINRQGLFKAGTVQRVVEEYMGGRDDHQWLIISLMSIACWLDQQ
jgi:hypothetical protein